MDAETSKQLDHFFACGHTLVGTLNDEPECAVHCTEGGIYLHQVELPLWAVTAVTTSRIARGHAFAQRLTAQQLAYGAQQGAAVAALGMFDQGFYDKVGFGTGAYDHSFTLDPGTLMVDKDAPTPARLSREDYPAMHAAMLNRQKVNGSVCLYPPVLVQAELGFEENGFGLGYYHGEQLTHFVWLTVSGEHGPYKVRWMAYQNPQQLMELLALLRSLADQVYSLKIMEPPEIQLQNLLHRPFRNMALAEDGKHAAEHESFAWWQFRILDLAACIRALTPVKAVSFQLVLNDPVEALLDTGHKWRGIGGRYVVHLAEQSRVEPGSKADLPVLECSVNALSRLLWSVMPASSLAITDNLKAPAALLADLDQALAGAPPHPGWDF